MPRQDVMEEPSGAGRSIARPRRGDRSVGEDPDLVRFYLDEIGTTPLLTAAEEVELAKRIEAGLFARRLLDEAVEPGHGRLSSRRRRELLDLAADGVAARDHMVRANLRLVVSV